MNLDTWELRAGPELPPGWDTFGQAALYSNATGVPMLWAFVMTKTDNVVGGFDVRSGTISIVLNCTTWPGGGPYFIEAVFEYKQALLVIGSYGSADPTVQSLYLVAGAGGPSPTVTLLGNISCMGLGGYCADTALDATRGLLYQVSGESDDDDSGGLVATDLATLTSVTTYPLQAHFEFPQWDSVTSTLLGLTLVTGGPAGYARNVTALNDPAGAAYNATSHGSIGEGFYVVLEGGPKAFDSTTRRLFYMLAGGPFAEFDVTVVDADSIPPKIEETPGLCGFIGYCPQAFAFGAGA